ncbi:thiopeptide-type bacteriocin biosynthesis protein [Kaistella sp.]|uniref:thiopeptide-type bacteriocin biosynthesis protein n=1 Tax=Kaistella sp. TaxID=2782235 RepID=UPI003C4AF884
MHNNTRTYNILGSDWIYYKLYMGTKSSDDILVEKIKPLAEQLLAKNIINQWFFIRYNDPKCHLRIRFKCVHTSLINEIIAEMHNVLLPLTEESIIWKIQIDTYNREIERYGSKTIEIAEKLFFYDSIMVVDYLKNFNDENLRWLFGLKAIDDLLDLFQYKLSDKKNFLETLSNAFKAEFAKSKITNNGLSDKFRVYKQTISDTIDSKNPNNIYDIIEERNNSIKNLKDEILALLRTESLEVNLNSFLASHIHMMINRLFKSKNRAHEMVCYDFLFRYYKSKQAITNNVKIIS